MHERHKLLHLWEGSFFSFRVLTLFLLFLVLGFPKIRAGGREKKSEAKKKKWRKKKVKGEKKPVRYFSAQECVLLQFRANPGLWWGIFGKMDKISVT